MGSGAPEIALHNGRVPDGSPGHDALTRPGDAATLLSLFPFAIFTAATAVVALQTRVLPRWLAVLAAVAAVALVANGPAVGSDSVPALLLFIAWVLVAGICLTIRPAGRTATAPAPATAAI